MGGARRLGAIDRGLLKHSSKYQQHYSGMEIPKNTTIMPPQQTPGSVTPAMALRREFMNHMLLLDIMLTYNSFN